jgi:hypothetical protein
MFHANTYSHSYWFNDNFGTLYRSSSRPHNNNPLILINGNKVAVEFRSTNQGGRRRVAEPHGDNSERYGFRVAINAIYAENNLTPIDNIITIFGKKNKSNKSKAKDVQNWISLLNTLVHSSSVMSQMLIKGRLPLNLLEGGEHQKSKSVVTWNILRGGITVGALDEKSENPIAEYVKELKAEKGIAFEV